MKAMISDGKSIFSVDVVDYQGKLWIVSVWREFPKEGYKRPARIICLSDLKHQDLRGKKNAPADFSVSTPIPISVLDGIATAGYRVIEEPDVRFPLSKFLH